MTTSTCSAEPVNTAKAMTPNEITEINGTKTKVAGIPAIN